MKWNNANWLLILLLLQTWMCGGRLETIPCSHVGHIFRSRSPYSWKVKTANPLKHNLLRLAEVVLGDDYKHFYFSRVNFNEVGVFSALNSSYIKYCSLTGSSVLRHKWTVYRATLLCGPRCFICFSSQMIHFSLVFSLVNLGNWQSKLYACLFVFMCSGGGSFEVLLANPDTTTTTQTANFYSLLHLELHNYLDVNVFALAEPWLLIS